MTISRSLIIAAGLFFLALAPAISQAVLDPKPIVAVCAYNASLPTVTSGQWTYVQCDSTGKLLLH